MHTKSTRLRLVLVGQIVSASVALSGAVAMMPTPADAQGWETEATPAPARASDSQLTAVSCAGAAMCMAVGEHDDGLSGSGSGSDVGALAESWNGSAWSLVPTAPTSAPGASLMGVSCDSPDNCEAVGETGSSGGIALPYGGVLEGRGAVPLAEAWNGTTWIRQIVPSAVGSSLQGVTCPSTRSCIAVGSRLRGTPRAPRSEPVAMAWNGRAWSVLTTPQPERRGRYGDGSWLSSVSCAAADACTALGSYDATPQYPVATYEPLVEVWSGSAWRLEYAPPAYSRDGQHLYAQETGMSAVSCATHRACLAVGIIEPQNGAASPFADRWDGQRWRTATAGLPHFSSLYGVSCTSASTCTAVGQYDPSDFPAPTATRPLVATWSGGRWRRVAAPQAAVPSGQYFNVDPALLGVDCPALDTCTAVGAQAGTSGRNSFATLAQSDTPLTPTSAAISHQ